METGIKIEGRALGASAWLPDGVLSLFRCGGSMRVGIVNGVAIA
jgi:hypothetical protein